MKKFQNNAHLMVADSETDANMLYATKFFVPDPIIYFQIKNKTFLVTSDLEIDRAKKTATVNNVVSLTRTKKQLKKSGIKKPETVDIIHNIFGKRNISTILVPANFPVELADGLRKKRYKVNFKKDPFFDSRQIKTPTEIKYLIKSLQVAEKGMEAGTNLIKTSMIGKGNYLYINDKKLTSEIVKAKINTTMMKLGCVPSHTIVACGTQCCDPHNEGTGPLKADSPIIIDIFPRSQETGYWGDITRTVVKGKASSRLKEAYCTVLKGQEIGFKMVKDGIDGKDVHSEILKFFKKSGFPTKKGKRRMEGFFHGTGHGVGLEVHEYPRINPDSFILKAGHVVTVEPGLYYPGMGGVRLEDVVVVTKSGIKNLTTYPKFLEIP